jgi:hypothetical protein
MQNSEDLVRENAALRKEVKELKLQLKQQAEDNAKLTELLFDLPEKSPAIRQQGTKPKRNVKVGKAGLLGNVKKVFNRTEDKTDLPNSDVDLLRQSDWFDAEWYLQTYPDVKQSGMDPVLHYVIHGGKEGRDPSPQFNSLWYLGFHMDVAEQGVNPLIHYLRQGMTQSREIQPSDKADS